MSAPSKRGWSPRSILLLLITPASACALSGKIWRATFPQTNSCDSSGYSPSRRVDGQAVKNVPAKCRPKSGCQTPAKSRHQGGIMLGLALRLWRTSLKGWEERPVTAIQFTDHPHTSSSLDRCHLTREPLCRCSALQVTSLQLVAVTSLIAINL